MLQAFGVFLLVAGVILLSILGLGIGQLLKRRCILRPCGTEGPTREACAECPVARAGSVGTADTG